MSENMSFIVDFISERLASFIVKTLYLQYLIFKEHFETVSTEIDFSKNLTIPVNNHSC